MKKLIIEKMKKVLNAVSQISKLLTHPSKVILQEDYKKKASEQAINILEPYVRKQKTFENDKQAREVILAVLNLTNFFNWRDLSYITKDLL